MTTRLAKQKVFNLEVDGRHNYAVSRPSVLVHNACDVLTRANILEHVLDNHADEFQDMTRGGIKVWIEKVTKSDSIWKGKDGWQIWRDGNKIIIDNGGGTGTAFVKNTVAEASTYVQNAIEDQIAKGNIK